MSSVNHDDFAHLKIPLEDILSATNNFDEENNVEKADFGNQYPGQLLWSGELINICARRYNKEWSKRDQEFWMEISMLSSLKHKNLVSLVGFCDENDERIIIIKYETYGSLDNYLSDAMMLTWVRRLEICVSLANALSYIHYDEARDFSVIHRNIDSLNVLLNDNWEPKLSEFRLSMKIEASQRHRSFHVDKVCDIEGQGYTDPTYIETKIVSHKSDIYSFGIVMFELVCGRKAVINDDQDNKYLVPMAILHYREEKLEDIVDWNLSKQIDPQSFKVFTEIAYDCLNEERSQRPNINEIVTKLEKALELAHVNQPEDPYHLLDYDEEEDPEMDIEEEEPEEDPPGNMNGWVDDDADMEKDDYAEIIFPYEVQGDQTPPPRDESSDSDDEPEDEDADDEPEAEDADDELEVEDANVESEAEEPDGVPEAAIGTGSQRPFAVRNFPMGFYEAGESSTARDPHFVGGLAPWALRRDLEALRRHERIREAESETSRTEIALLGSKAKIGKKIKKEIVTPLFVKKTLCHNLGVISKHS
nr:protein kinase-like domain-containing protein [Tanacetum cinerariifolium]